MHIKINTVKIHTYRCALLNFPLLIYCTEACKGTHLVNIKFKWFYNHKLSKTMFIGT